MRGRVGNTEMASQQGGATCRQPSWQVGERHRPGIACASRATQQPSQHRSLPSHMLCPVHHGRIHPFDRGHKAMAEALLGPLKRAVAEAAAPPVAAACHRGRQAARLEGMLPPMVPGNYEPNTPLCAIQARLQRRGSSSGLGCCLCTSSSRNINQQLCCCLGGLPTCVVQENFKPLVTRTSGFEYVPERPDAPTFSGQKWGWTGLTPGADPGRAVCFGQ
jgi:hypothetical protein